MNGQISNSDVTLVTGDSGIGKTRLVLEVCRNFEKKGWKVLCVKSNSLPIHVDMKDYISEAGKYLIFIDDVNQITYLDYILNFPYNNAEDIKIKFVFTVRSYAKERVKNDICKNNYSPNEVLINKLESNDIKEILDTQLGIKSEEYIEKIAEIARGNCRLAVLAGETSKRDGYVALNNSIYIFANYYKNIKNDLLLDDKMICVLFIISVFGPMNLNDSSKVLDLLESKGINLKEYKDKCSKLNENELVDIYEDELVKINDQSLGDYIIEYVLIEKEIIKISDLLNFTFPDYKNKLLYALNTIHNLFYCDATEEYVKKQVGESWDRADENIQWEYLKCFHNLYQIKSLRIIKKRIQSMGLCDFDLSKFDFKKNMNCHYIKTDEISILCDFKYTDNYNTAIELLIRFFENRPDLVMDFYFAFSDKLSYDRYSFDVNYEKEYFMIDNLWKSCAEGKNVNLTILFLYVAKKILHCHCSKNEPGRSLNTLQIISFSVVLNEGSKKIRSFIWSKLHKLYDNNIYQKIIDGIISENYYTGMAKDEAKSILDYDLKCIKEEIFDKWNSLTFNQSLDLWRLRRNSTWLNMDDSEIFNICKSDENYIIYSILMNEHKHGVNIQTQREIMREKIKKLISGYNMENFRKMFDLCKNLDNEDDIRQYYHRGLKCVFEILQNDRQKYLDVIKVYFETGAPKVSYPEQIISYLIKQIGFKKTKKMIDSYNFAEKHIWQMELWNNIPCDIIDENYIKDFLNYLELEMNESRPQVPNIAILEKYKKVDTQIIKKVSEIILEAGKDKNYIVKDYLENMFKDDDLDLLDNLFKADMDILEKLYIIMEDDTFDYEGKLLLRLIKNNNKFWNEFTLEHANNIGKTFCGNNIFEIIWGLDNFEDLIDIAYNNVFSNNTNVLWHEKSLNIFSDSDNTSDLVKERKELWIKKYIKNNINNADNLKEIFYIILYAFPNKKITYFSEFLKYSKDYDLFKMMPLHPYSLSWCGSEIPIIDEEIDFLKSLINSIPTSIDYIDHKAYIEEEIKSAEKDRKLTLKQEYLDNDII